MEPLRYYLFLVHYPVYNKRGDVVVSSITNLDIHDISRLVKTYCGKAFFMITPLSAQKAMIERITSHWKAGFGAVYNPTRDEALKLVRVADSIEDAVKKVEEAEGQRVLLVATSAKKREGKRISYRELSRIIRSGEMPVAILLGTGWGLTEDVIKKCDFVLDPIEGLGNYNHLSVRCAAAIILDRILGRKDDEG
ncbi:MAG: RNA methyltransferase [Deferribacteres bacterium]|nr:RNA methyltransferase [Deferribacteres bacterium]